MTKPWLTLDEVRERVRTGEDKLRECMVATDRAGVDRPWVNNGTQGRPIYIFEATLVDAWWREVNEWRVREGSPAGSGKSGGETPTAPSSRSRSPRRALATSTSKPSENAKSLASDTSPNARALSILRSGTA